MRRGPLLSLVREGPHPYETAQHARRILASAALAATRSPEEAARRFARAGLTTHVERVESSMRKLEASLRRSSRGLNNLYLHVTFGCNLRCDHCYAGAGHARKGVMPPEALARICADAARTGFRHVVVTGGEPLVHPQRDELLDALAGLRTNVKPLLTVLRTNLAVELDAALIERLSRSTDQVVVSVDGDEATHDARRGAGSYKRTVSNLRALVALEGESEISLATVLPLAQVSGQPGDSVRALAASLGVRRTRFRPLLPLGRALESELEIVPETLWGHLDPVEMMAFGFTPTASCGFGQNLYVEPDGGAYPCYAWHGEPWRLGSVVGENALLELLDSERFRGLKTHTVDSNRGCAECSLRYLCGGACRAWNRQGPERQTDPDAPPLDCGALHARARSLMLSALDHLQVSPEQWRSAGLPLADVPPLQSTNG